MKKLFPLSFVVLLSACGSDDPPRKFTGSAGGSSGSSSGGSNAGSSSGGSSAGSSSGGSSAGSSSGGSSAGSSSGGSSAGSSSGGSSAGSSSGGSSSGGSSSGGSSSGGSSSGGSSSGGSSSGGAGGSGVTCSGSNRCVDVPAGWTGPVAYASFTGSKPACPTDYPTVEHDLSADFDAGTATCGCTCGNPSITCGPVWFNGYSSANCSNVNGGDTLTVGECKQVSGTSNVSERVHINSATGTCGAPSTSSNIPTPKFNADARICGGVTATGDTCAGSNEICVPQPGTAPYGKMCIYTNGDATCPTGFTDTREVVYEGYTDNRACSACSCSPQNVSCYAVINRYQNTANNCGSTPFPTNVTQGNPFCTSSAQISALSLGSVVKSQAASCQKSGGTLGGVVAPTQARTVCCAN